MNDYRTLSILSVVLILLVSPAVLAAPISQASYSTGDVATGGAVGSQTNLKGNGVSCSADSECASNICLHSVCRPSSPFCGDGFCDSGESCSSDDSACTSGYACTSGCQLKTVGATTTSAAVTTKEAPTIEEVPEEEKVITPEEIVITDVKTIEEITTVIKPEDLGVSEINIENLEVKQTGKVEVSTKADLNTVEKVLTTATGEAKQILGEVKTAVSAGAAITIPVTSKVEVFEVKEKTTGKSVFTSKVTVTFTADRDLKNVDIVEVIPKNIATSVDEIKFLGAQPKILQADPVVQWSFVEVKQGETKDLSYQISKKIEKVETTTIAVAESEVVPEVPKKPSILPVIYVIIGLVVIIAIYFTYKTKLFHYKK